MLVTIMQILDTSITNVALPHMPAAARVEGLPEPAPE
jgi:hypothetical protein